MNVRLIVVKALGFLVTLLMVFVLSRALIRFLPGDPMELLEAETGGRVSAASIREELRLNEPFASALVSDLGSFVRGDLGLSFIRREPVAPMLVSRAKATLELVLLASLIGTVLSLTFGLGSNLGRSSRFARFSDRACTLWGALSAALPSPWLGPILVLILCVWIPVAPLGESPVLPSLTLALLIAGVWARLIRQRVRDTLHAGRINTPASAARARGIPELRILWKYGLAPASGALIAFWGTQLGALLAGSFVIETVFNWPGMGMLIVDGILARDYPVVEAGIFWAAAMTLGGNFLGDSLRVLIDPRTRDA